MRSAHDLPGDQLELGRLRAVLVGQAGQVAVHPDARGRADLEVQVGSVGLSEAMKQPVEVGTVHGIIAFRR